jgi:hypothetical protein
MMPEDEETAMARYIAGSVSTQLMLKSLFELIAMTTDNPDEYRFGNTEAVAGDSGHHATGPDGRSAGEKSPRLRQGNGRRSVDQRATKLAENSQSQDFADLLVLVG